MFFVLMFVLNLQEIYSLQNITDDDSNSLLLLHVIHRHGDRTRDTFTYPNNPYINESYYPFGIGQLTNKGKNRMYTTGVSLRERYDAFLGNIFYPEIVDARSTDFNRTKVSLALTLAGLFPAKGPLSWSPTLDWLPVPYNYEKLENDFILGHPNYFCPKYNSYFDEYQAKEGASLFNDDSHLYQYISEHSGLNITNPKLMYFLYISLKTEEEWELRLPPWTESIWELPLRQAAVKQYKIQVGNDTLKRLSTGFFLKKVIEDSINKINNTLYPRDRKIFIYSGHEFNIAFILGTLGILPENFVPNYGSHIIIELRKINDIYGFQFLFQDNQNDNEPQILNIPGCDVFCPVDKFVELTKNIIPTNELECKL